MTAMIDRLYLGITQHLPEVPEELAESAVAGAKRRHRKWMTAIEKLLNVVKGLDKYHVNIPFSMAFRDGLAQIKT